MSLTSPNMTVMTAAVRKASRKLSRDFGEVENLQVAKKGPSDFVTRADIAAEKVLREELERARPGYSFLLEEAGEIKGTDATHRWIIDPLDGTLNFMHAIPHFAISLALERDGVIVAGVIYNPITDELYTAERGRGAYLNNHRLRVSARTNLTECLFATGLPFHGKPNHEPALAEVGIVMAMAAGVRRFGAAALDLAYLAAGRYDGFWERGLQPWDMAAGILMVREAGGTVTDFSGGDNMLKSGEILASNGAVQGRFSDLLAKGRKGGTPVASQKR